MASPPSPRSSLRFGTLTRTKTAHVVGPKVELLRAEPDMSPYMFPLLRFDLAECAEGLDGHLMFIYAEYAESSAGLAEGLAFRVDEEGRYILDEPSTATFRRFIAEVALPPSPSPKTWKGKHLQVHSASNLAADGLIETRSAIGRLVKGRRVLDYPLFGGTPYWIQPSRAVPVDPDGQPMLFIGQLCAAYLTDYAADYELLLFYSPKHRLVMQYAQNS